MDTFRRQVAEATGAVRARLAVEPKIGLILGTGLGGIVDSTEIKAVIPYGEIPHHPVSTVTSHHGRFINGSWAGRPILVMQGRFHLYEGLTARQISFPIRIMRGLGIETLIITNAAGGLDPLMNSGDLMLVSDHINLTGQNPLTGPNVDDWGVRFSDMTEPYSRRLRSLAIQAALYGSIGLHQGVYAGLVGPSLETAAETRMLRALGADAVGMSLVNEVITAIHAGMEVLAFSVISNVNLPDHYVPAPIEVIVENAALGGRSLTRLLETVVPQI